MRVDVPAGQSIPILGFGWPGRITHADDPLTEREIEVLTMIAMELQQIIADKLSITSYGESQCQIISFLSNWAPVIARLQSAWA